MRFSLGGGAYGGRMVCVWRGRGLSAPYGLRPTPEDIFANENGTGRDLGGGM